MKEAALLVTQLGIMWFMCYIAYRAGIEVGRSEGRAEARKWADR